MPRVRSLEDRRWLRTEPKLEELIATFPAEWMRAREDMIAESDAGTISSLAAGISNASSQPRDRLKPDRQLLADLVRGQMVPITRSTIAVEHSATPTRERG